MPYVEDMKERQQRHLAFWNKENHDRPTLLVTAPKEGAKHRAVTPPPTLEQRWTDEDYIIESSRAWFESTWFGGESLPTINPNLGPDIFGAYLGCDIVFGESTSWAKPIIQDWETYRVPAIDTENPWWKKMLHMTEHFVEDSNGDYLVGITDLHPGSDGLVSLRGPQELCCDLLDYPEQVKQALWDTMPPFRQSLDTLYKLTTRHQWGSTNWSGLWHPGNWYIVCSDFSCMISQEMYREFVLPELTAEVNSLDASFYHLDGPGALKHLDDILSIEKLGGVQWVYGAGQPTAAHWLPVLQKIQNAGKLIQVEVFPQDLDVLLENLRPEGVMMNLSGARTEEEAKALIRKVEKSYKRKYF